VAAVCFIGGAGLVPVAAPAVTTSPAGEGRLLANAGFEAQLASWTADAGTVTAVSGPVHGGAGAAQLVDTSTANGVSLRSAPLAVVPGEELTATIWVLQTAGSGGSLYLEFWRADGTRTTPVTATGAGTATGWRQLTTRAAAPADAVTATVLAYSSWAEVGTTVWDDASVSALAPPLRAVPNPGFEEQRDPSKPTEWTVTQAGGPVTFVRGGNVHSGATAIQIDDNSTAGEVSVLSRAVPVAVGETITASAWANRIDGSGATLYLEFRDANGTRLGTPPTVNVTGTGWQKVGATGTAPSGTTTLTVRLYSTQPGTGTTRWDDVSLRSSADAAYDPALAAAAPVLFVGDQRVESYTGVSRVVHPGTKGADDGIVLTGFSDWDANPRMSGTVLPGGPGEPAYKMWYTTTGGTGYVTSNDGITWSRNGRTSTVSGLTTAGVVQNPLWTSGGSQPRYFMMQAAGSTQGYIMQQSSDGIAWTAVPGSKAIPGFDVAMVTYDPATRRFVAMTKHQLTAPYGPRTTWVSTSTDFKTWTTPRPAFAADLLDDQLIPDGYGLKGMTPWSEIYGMPAIRYGDQYLGTPWIFDINYSPYRDAGNPGVDHGRMHIGVAASRDLVNWSRPDRTDLVTPGPKGSWDWGFSLSSNGFLTVKLPDGQWQTRFYYGAFAGEHTCGSADKAAGECTTVAGNSKIGLVTWPADRFESFHANGATGAGTVTTRPLSPAGGTLSVNYDPGTGGSLRVEVLDADGNAIPGYGAADATPITANALAPGAIVTWGDRATLPAGPVRLRFHLTGGDLYEYAIG